MIDLDEIKSEDKERIDDELKDTFKDKKTQLYSDAVLMSKTFLVCYDIVNSKLEHKQILTDYFSIVKELRKEMNEYEYGEGYSDYITKLRIKNIIDLNREKIIEFLNAFDKRFIEMG